MDNVFCIDCEQLLNKNGESCVLANIARPEGFPLFEKLERSAASFEYDDGYGYETDGIPEIAN